MINSKQLILLTARYPFQGQEQFLIGEYYNIAKLYDHVHVFPLSNNKNLIDKLPENLTIHNELSVNHSGSIVDYFVNFHIIFKIFYSELISNNKRLSFLLNIRYHLSEIIAAIRSENIFNQKIKKLSNSSVLIYHSAWMNKNALMLSIAKSKKHIDKFTFRVHGYDIFNERHKNNYIPFENYNYKHTNAVILNSKFSFNYKLKQNISPTKLKLNYFGVDIKKSSIFIEQDIFTIVSCSGIIPLKRVEIIAKSLKYIDFKIKWTHFGDGPNRNTVQNICSKLPSNVAFDFKGNVPNENLLDFYENNMINLFIHVSETEGLGFAIIEAQSFGIPAMACGAGGVNDIVNDSSGVKLPIKITPQDLALEIKSFRNSNKNKAIYRSKVIQHFKDNFEMTKNIDSFNLAINS